MNGQGFVRLARRQWDSLAAIVLGCAIVLGVQVVDGGSLGSLLQVPAALIVFGGTCAATLVSYSPRAIREALEAAWDAFQRDDEDIDQLSAELVALSIRAHRGGLLALERHIDDVRDPFLRNGLTLVVDGVNSETLRDALNVQRVAQETREDVPVRIFEAAAGYAPTLGILGAVLGLIRVMEHLTAPASLGSGVATAFVATVYGVGSANLVLLPIAGRLRERNAARARRRDLIAEALLDMQRRMSPRMVAHKARQFTEDLPRVEDIARRVSQESRPVREFTA